MQKEKKNNSFEAELKKSLDQVMPHVLSPQVFAENLVCVVLRGHFLRVVMESR